MANTRQSWPVSTVSLIQFCMQFPSVARRPNTHWSRHAVGNNLNSAVCVEAPYTDNPQISTGAGDPSADLSQYFTPKETAEFFPRIIENNTVKGKLVAIPFFKFSWLTEKGVLAMNPAPEKSKPNPFRGLKK